MYIIIKYQLLNNKDNTKMEFEDNKSNPDDQNIQEILQDIVLTEDSNNFCFVKRDNTIFVIDCSHEIMVPLVGEKQSEFDKVMESYKNFMMSKVIANCSDRVGLIFYNVNKKQNSLNFDHIYTVNQLEAPTAKMIKAVDKIKKDFILNYGHSDQKVSLHQVLWLFGQEIKDCDSFKNHVRLFLFTSQDCPHTEADEKRQQAINHARQLAAKGAHIELFPIKKTKNSKFELRKFYQQIITFDTEDLNKNLLDSSSKIMDLQTRIRQKQFKKRTLNRLLMQIGQDTYIGMQIYAMFSKARKPLCKRLESTTNKPLKRVIKRLNVNGQVLFNQQIGTFYPLADQRIILTKEDINKIKGLRKPGITLVGFKPKKLIKPYHNLRPSYFLYPDEDHVTGSSQFVDALINELIATDQIAIVSILPRQNQQLRFAALYPQQQSYDIQDHHQTPPGFHMIILPYSDDIVNFAGGQKTIVRPTKVSIQLVKLTKLLINNLTVSDFDFRNFENPSLQKFYCHLQAHALNQQVVEEKEDTIIPDYQGFQKFSDIFKMVEETADAEVQQQMPDVVRKPKRGTSKKEQKKQEQDLYEPTANKSKRPSSKSKEKQKKQDKMQESKMDIQKTDQIEKKSKFSKKDSKKQIKQQDMSALFMRVQSHIQDGNAASLSKEQMAEFLKHKKLNWNGSKGELADRIMLYISFSL